MRLCNDRARPVAALAAAIGLALVLAPAEPARGDETPPTASIPAPPGRVAIERPEARRQRAGESGSTSGGWWIGSAGIALALAAFGAASLASRGSLLARSEGPLRVVGRLSLSPKQSIHLVQAGDRTLIIGTGAQGPPALLGEMDLPAAAGVRPAPGGDRP